MLSFFSWVDTLVNMGRLFLYMRRGGPTSTARLSKPTGILPDQQLCWGWRCIPNMCSSTMQQCVIFFLFVTVVFFFVQSNVIAMIYCISFNNGSLFIILTCWGNVIIWLAIYTDVNPLTCKMNKNGYNFTKTHTHLLLFYDKNKIQRTSSLNVYSKNNNMMYQHIIY